MSEIDILTERIIGRAMEVHRQLGPGYLESVYEKALSIELKADGIGFANQVAVPVLYRGQSIGDFIADIIVNGKVIVELKACQTLHIQQIFHSHILYFLLQLLLYLHYLQ